MYSDVCPDLLNLEEATKPSKSDVVADNTA
jgi:hypothetical protein